MHTTVCMLLNHMDVSGVLQSNHYQLHPVKIIRADPDSKIQTDQKLASTIRP